MTLFRYKAVTADGKTVAGDMEASDERGVIDRLRATGHLPISASPSAARNRWSMPGWLAGVGRRRIRRRDITALTREFATLLSAGLPIDTCLRTMERHSRDPLLENMISDIHAGIRDGRPLSDALASQAPHFDALYVSLIRSGEASGTLASILDRLADYRERTEAFRSSVVASLAYPAILLSVATLSLFILMSFVVPRFVPLFADAGATLPLMTKIVFAIAGLAQSLWWLGALGIIGALLYFDRWKSDPLNRRRLDAWLLKLPQLGDILRQVETARITRTLGSLTSNGLPLHSSLKLSREVCQNSVFRDLMDQCCSSIEQGRRLSESLESADVFPSLASELIAIGDESGQLEPMLLKVADSCEETAQKTIRRSLTLIEPVMILGLGAVIAFVIVAILMAMLGLNDLVA